VGDEEWSTGFCLPLGDTAGGYPCEGSAAGLNKLYFGNQQPQGAGWVTEWVDDLLIGQRKLSAPGKLGEPHWRE